jgi:hypothetical protein
MRPENLLQLDLRAESEKFSKPAGGIVDFHSHINGRRAVAIYREAARAYGVTHTYSMTQLDSVEDVRRELGESVDFIAIPNWMSSDPIMEHTSGYDQRLKQFWELGSRVAKFWCAPRIFDTGDFKHHEHPLRVNSPARMQAIFKAIEIGYKLMFHIADPDTWFATKYRDSGKYGTKAWHYEIFEEVLSQIGDTPVVVAHMGGSPENLERLSDLLTRYQNVNLDCSAAKWQVRELSKHPPQQLRDFFVRWSGRVLFGSDIVTAEAHLESGAKSHEMFAKANSETQAFDLYASRYWAFRTMLETDVCQPSPIADPDLAMVDPTSFTEMSSPTLRGFKLPASQLEILYSGAAQKFMSTVR